MMEIYIFHLTVMVGLEVSIFIGLILKACPLGVLRILELHLTPEKTILHFTWIKEDEPAFCQATEKEA